MQTSGDHKGSPLQQQRATTRDRPYIYFPVENKTYTLIGADGKPYESATKGTLGGHRKDKIYGTLNCAGAARWIAKGHYVKNRVFFADERAAIAAGYRPCYECLREKYNKWKTNNPKSKIQNPKS